MNADTKPWYWHSYLSQTLLQNSFLKLNQSISTSLDELVVEKKELTGLTTNKSTHRYDD